MFWNRKVSLAFFLLVSGVVLPKPGGRLAVLINLYLLLVGTSLGWTILVRLGLFSFGVAAFWGLGAYVVALAFLKGGVPGTWTLPLVAVAALLISFALGALLVRLNPLVFPLATLALVELFRVLALNMPSLTYGAVGYVGVPPLGGWMAGSRGGLVLGGAYLLLCGALALYYIHPLRALRVAAVEENPLVAEALGISLVGERLKGFVVSALTAALGGALYVFLFGVLDPGDLFSIRYSAMPMILGLLGGMALPLGPLWAGIGLMLVYDFWLVPFFPSMHHLFYGLVLMLWVWFLPGMESLEERE